MAVVERRMLGYLVSVATRRLLLRVAGEDVLMKHPVRSDFDTAVTEASVNVTSSRRTASSVFTDWLRARMLHALSPSH